jgi:hypothetical protein
MSSIQSAASSAPRAAQPAGQGPGAAAAPSQSLPDTAVVRVPSKEALRRRLGVALPIPAARKTLAAQLGAYAGRTLTAETAGAVVGVLIRYLPQEGPGAGAAKRLVEQQRANVLKVLFGADPVITADAAKGLAAALGQTQHSPSLEAALTSLAIDQDMKRAGSQRLRQETAVSEWRGCADDERRAA